MNDDFDDLNFDETDENMDFDADWSSDSGEYSENFDDSLDRTGYSFETNEQQLSEPQQKIDIIKAAVLVVIVGVILCIQALAAQRFLSGDNRNQAKDKTSQTYTQNEQPQVQNGENTVNSIQSQTAKEDKWQQFQGDTQGIEFNGTYQTAKFQITKVEHYVCVQESDSDYIQIKTTLTGQIQGYPGVYQLDIPYQLGKNLQVKSEPFDVQVLVGTYDGRTVIGDIRYY